MKSKVIGIDKYKVEALRLFKKIKQYIGLTEQESQCKALISQVRVLPAFKDLSETEIMSRLFLIDLNDCRHIIALEQNLDSWSELVNQTELENQEITEDKLVYRDFTNDKCLNYWFATYEEAKIFQEERKKKYLFPYKNTYFVSEKAHIEDMGLDPNDEDWDKIGRDWVRPKDIDAKNRLREKLLKTYKETN